MARGVRNAKRKLAQYDEETDLLHSCIPAYKRLKKAIHNNMVLITGPPSVGKKTITTKVFQEHDNYLYAYVNCYTSTTPAKFYSTICQGFSRGLNIRRADMVKIKLPDCDKPVSCHDFRNYFAEYLRFSKTKGIVKLYVVLDHIEALQKTNLLGCFTALVSIRELNIIIITYEAPIDIVNYATSISKAAGVRIQERIMPVVVPTWSQEDTIKWILSYPPREEVEIYKKFVANVVNSVYMTDYADPKQTLLYCQDNFEEFLNYYRQSLSGKTTAANSVKTYLKSFTNTIRAQKTAKRKWTASDVEIKLPLNTIALIIAAYVAAYTKPVDDRKNFVKFQKKSKDRGSKPDYISRPFTFERLYHVYKGIQHTVNGKVGDNIIHDNGFVLGDVERLENLNILIHQSGWSVHPESRYRLSPCIRRDYIKRLADNIELEFGLIHGLSNHCEES